MTPLRVDPVLLGLPPVEKKPPATVKPSEPPPERVRAEVKPVEAQAVESKPLEAEGDVAATEAKTKSGARSRASSAASSDQVPARAVAPAAAPAAPVSAAPAPAPAPMQSSSPVVAAPAPRPREQEAAARGTPGTSGSPASRSVATAPVPAPASGGKITTLEPLRVHPGLLGLPVVAGSPASPGRAPSSLVAGTAYSPPATLSGLAQERNDAWRAGRPPVLGFESEALDLPDGATPTLALRTDKTLEPIQSGGQPLPMFLTADELSGITGHETVASGDAEARRAGLVVNAERLTYWPVEDELEAAGDVRLAKGDDYVTGPRMRMKMVDQTGVFDQPNFFLKRESSWAAQERKRQEKGAKGSAVVAAAGTMPATKAQMSRPEEGSLMNVLGVSADEPAPLPLTEARGSAERIDFEGESKLRIINGNYTTCKAPDPGWYLKSDELALDYDRQVGEGKNATLYFQNAPIFWSPWLSFSLNNQRKSGFLAPTFGSSSVNGLTLATPYYWNIAPNMDATIAPRVYAKRGLQLGSEFRYLDHNYAGNVRGEFLPNDRLGDDEDRYAYSLRHQQNLGRGFTGTLNISGVSDDQYFTDLASRSVLSSQRQLLRQGMVSYGSDWWSANVIGQAYQTLNPDADPTQQIAKPYSLAPQININARRPDFFRTDAAFFGQYSAFTHSKLDEGRRTVAYPQLSVPFVQPGWYVTPKIGAHVTSYSLDRRISTGDTSISRSLPIFSVDAGMTFERDTTWFGAKATQTLEPRLYYLSVPYEKQTHIPVFDSAVADFNFATIFSENQFTGYDRVSDANQLTAAVTTRLIDPTSGAEAMRAMFGQRYYFQRQRVTLDTVALPLAEQGKWNKSDFLMAFSGRVLPKTYLDAALQYNPSDTRMERSSLGARYQPELGKVLNASYRFASKEVSSGALKNVDVAGQWPIWGGWSAVGRYNYSILDHKPVETVAGLEYNAGCWAVRVVGHQVVTTTGRDNTSVFVQLELNDFARIGSNPIDLLRRNVQGYGLSNQPVADPVFGE
ncbi:MAG: LPS assembly protein LptD [Betaproteobacteria bacterium]|uniref:LPS-assembly protein LptD n=1 Tax=Candidatus Proximibacter danicus TaxID=2954365 RepID=A0A9D7JZB7_9PROT|nr:LPS assembly protein LptD [Candidatus Proximibacter danicus]